MTRVYRFLADATALTMVKKTKTRPWGLEGGLEAEPNHVIVRAGSDREDRGGSVYEQMVRGEVMVNNSGGGGGWGNPYERDPQAVLEDVRGSYVSPESARRDYGVVADPKSMTVDAEEDAALRRRALTALP